MSQCILVRGVASYECLLFCLGIVLCAIAMWVCSINTAQFVTAVPLRFCDERVAILISFLDYYRMVDHTSIVVSAGFA